MHNENASPEHPGHAVLAALRAVASHAWLILLIRHRGEGLQRVKGPVLLVLVMVSAVMLMASTYYAPGDGRSQQAVKAVLFYLGFLSALGVVGARTPVVAGYAILTLVTEPICLIVRYLPGGSVADSFLTFWTTLAAFMLYIRVSVLEATP
ncbi:TPA: hypothetical protein ACRMWJ_005767 [Pseudomonas aeruginosa]